MGAFEHGLGQFYFGRQGPTIQFVVCQNQHFGITGTERRHDLGVANTVHMFQSEWDQIVGQAIVVASQVGDGFRAGAQGMEYQAWRFVSVLAIGLRHHVHDFDYRLVGRFVHGDCGCGANRRA